MTEVPDRELVARCRAGGPGAQEGFRDLFLRHAPEVLRLERRLLGCEDAARDAVQETFLRLDGALRAGSYDAAAPLRPYLLGIARRVAIAALRRREKERKLQPLTAEPAAGAGASGPERALRRERATLVDEALAALAPEHRAAILLRHAHGLTVQDTGAALGCSERTVRNRLRAAAALFARELRRRGLGDASADRDTPEVES